MDWSEWLQGGLNTAIDGYVAVETVKAENEKIPPQPVTQPVEPTNSFTTATIDVMGTPVNKAVLVLTGLVLTGIAVYKVAS